MTRAENVERARELRAQGLLLRQIAEAMDSKVSTVHAWLSDPDLVKHHARRARYAGKCVDCGARTDGSNGPGKAAQRCAHCNGIAQGKANIVWTREKIIGAIRAWAETHGDPPAVADWHPNVAAHLNDTERSERAKRGLAEGTHPHPDTVRREFGGWAAALEASGFTARAPHGGAGNELRRRATREQAAA